MLFTANETNFIWRKIHQDYNWNQSCATKKICKTCLLPLSLTMWSPKTEPNYISGCYYLQHFATNIVKLLSLKKPILCKYTFRKIDYWSRKTYRDFNRLRNVGRLVRLHRSLLWPPVAPVGADVAPGLNFIYFYDDCNKKLEHFRSTGFLHYL